MVIFRGQGQYFACSKSSNCKIMIYVGTCDSIWGGFHENYININH